MPEETMASRYMKMQMMAVGYNPSVDNTVDTNAVAQRERVQQQVQHVQQHNPVPQPQSHAGRVGGAFSEVLPDLHRTRLGESTIKFGNPLAHGDKRGSGVHFGTGTVVDVTRLSGFGNNVTLPGTMPPFTAPILKKR